jgi:transcription elongation factor Elf1
MTDIECDSLVFPLECPACGRISGAPYAAATVPGNGVVIELRCKDCGHEWRCRMPHTGGDVDVQPKADRRQNPVQ